MAKGQVELALISGDFFRVVFDHSSDDVLSGAASPQGRYHHDQQPALYMSPKPEWAWKAVASYIQPDDPTRCVQTLSIEKARVVDIRSQEMCRKLKINPADSVVPWQPQLLSGTTPQTWAVSDRARKSGADGLIYTARTTPYRWHLVLFRWNGLGGPTVELSRSGNADFDFAHHLGSSSG